MLPELYECLGFLNPSLANCDDSIDDGLSDKLINSSVWCNHFARHFCGDVYYIGGLFCEDAYQYHHYQETVSATTLRELMNKVNDKYGWE